MKRPEPAATVTSGRISVELELAQYLMEPPLGDNIDPVAFWAGYRAKLPQLYAVAQNHLSITASSGGWPIRAHLFHLWKDLHPVQEPYE